MNKNDYLSIISSLSSKEEEINSHTPSPIKDNAIQKKKKELKIIETNLTKKNNLSESSSSISSLDSFELEFEDVYIILKYI